MVTDVTPHVSVYVSSRENSYHRRLFLRKCKKVYVSNMKTNKNVQLQHVCRSMKHQTSTSLLLYLTKACICVWYKSYTLLYIKVFVVDRGLNFYTE